MAINLFGPHAFRSVVTTVVAVVVAPFFTAIIIATWSGDRCGRSSQDVVDVVHGRRGRSSVEPFGMAR